MTRDATRTAIGTGTILPENTLLSDRYRIVRLLGVGAMGMVYLARDTQLDIDVALKVLRSGGAAGDRQLERFRSELILARQISHRNVVRIHDIGQSDDMHYISMDYVDGESLKHRLDQGGALDAARATAIAIDLAEALAEAHRADIVHRDIKPANVLIGSDRAYLTDFGVARSIHSDGLTKTGEVVGTLDYLSPEQARGAAVDGRADIYALGLLLYEMVAGTRPFSGETAEEVLAQRTLARPPDMAAGGVDIPQALRRIIERCLAVDPQERYQNADQLASDLRAGNVRRRWRPIRPQTAGLAAAVALAALGLWVFWPGAGPGPSAGAGPMVRPVAVLPFEVSVQTGDLGGIAHALSDLLTEQLSTSPDVQLVASQRVHTTMQDLQLSGAALPASDRTLLGDLLDAEYLIEGRLNQINQSFRLEARLRNAASGELLYRASVDIDEAPKVFDGIGSLARQLLSNFAASDTTMDALLPSVSWEALNDYALGVERLLQGNALDAVGPLQSAVRTAPDFALAWDRLAQALSNLGRDREALAAAESAVAALGEGNSRAAALVRARKAALAGELENSEHALEALLENHPSDTEARFMLAEVYGDEGRLSDANAALLQVVRVSPDHPQAWYLLGKFSILQGDARRAADEYLVKALVIQNRLDNDQGRADVLNALGIAQAQTGNPERAAEYYRQALALRRAIGDNRGVAAVLANLARIDLQDGRYDEARDGLIAARNKLKEIGDRWTVANLENELGFLEEQRGHFAEALSHYREGLRVRDGLGDLRAIAESYNNVGYAYYLLGEYDNAEVFIDRSLSTYRDTGNGEGIMLASQTRGILEISRGHYEDALKSLLESLQLSRDMGDQQAEAIAEGYIGRARHLQGRYASAAASFESALKKLEALGDVRGLAEFALRDAQLSLDTGMWSSAADNIERAKDLLKDDDNSARRALQLRVEGAYLDATGKARDAESRFVAALGEAEKSGELLAILHARLALAGRQNVVGGTLSRIDELKTIHDEGSRLGHGELRYESGIMLGRAYLAADRFSDAEAVLRSALQPFRAASEIHGNYRLHVLLADTLLAQGRAEEAATEWQQAGDSVELAMDAQTEGQRSAFRELPVVRRVLDHQRAGYES